MSNKKRKKIQKKFKFTSNFVQLKYEFVMAR